MVQRYLKSAQVPQNFLVLVLQCHLVLYLLPSICYTQVFREAEQPNSLLLKAHPGSMASKEQQLIIQHKLK